MMYNIRNFTELRAFTAAFLLGFCSLNFRKFFKKVTKIHPQLLPYNFLFPVKATVLPNALGSTVAFPINIIIIKNKKKSFLLSRLSTQPDLLLLLRLFFFKVSYTSSSLNSASVSTFSFFILRKMNPSSLPTAFSGHIVSTTMTR
jgi:hypothetical protein